MYHTENNFMSNNNIGLEIKDPGMKSDNHGHNTYLGKGEIYLEL